VKKIRKVYEFKRLWVHLGSVLKNLKSGNLTEKKADVKNGS
jgi:hypothetical protein